MKSRPTKKFQAWETRFGVACGMRSDKIQMRGTNDMFIRIQRKNVKGMFKALLNFVDLVNSIYQV